MTTSWESSLREDLRKLADVPNPDSPVDRALTGARQARRRRGILAGVGTTAVTVLIAIPVIATVPGGYRFLPFGSGQADVPCESTTDEADPPRGVPKRDYPGFVRDVLAKLPPRDDYTLQSSYGICDGPGDHGLSGYAVVNLGPNREHGHLTITVYYETNMRTCAAVTSGGARDILFCDDATDTRPFAIGRKEDGYGHTLTAVHTDTRAIVLELIGTPMDAAELRTVIADPALVDALP